MTVAEIVAALRGTEDYIDCCAANVIERLSRENAAARALPKKRRDRAEDFDSFDSYAAACFTDLADELDEALGVTEEQR